MLPIQPSRAGIPWRPHHVAQTLVSMCSIGKIISVPGCQRGTRGFCTIASAYCGHCMCTMTCICCVKALIQELACFLHWNSSTTQGLGAIARPTSHPLLRSGSESAWAVPHSENRRGRFTISQKAHCLIRADGCQCITMSLDGTFVVAKAGRHMAHIGHEGPATP